MIPESLLTLSHRYVNVISKFWSVGLVGTYHSKWAEQMEWQAKNY